MNPADISALVGRSYVTKSGRRCTLRKLGAGAIRADWSGLAAQVAGDALCLDFGRETQADRDEVEAWIQSVLESQGIKVDMETCTDEGQEAARYEAWKKK